MQETTTPMSAVVGHEAVVDLLKRTVHERRPAHAYLFSGREGIGKKRVAVEFACLLNCPSPTEEHDRSCPVCRRIVAEKHPDVTIERPEKDIIRIERIRELQGRFRYAPVEGRYRVAIIDDAHLMNRSAQNALLKILEEPPPARILILVSSKPLLLLPTVRSRCRRIRFGPVPSKAIAAFLEARHGLESERAALLAAMSGGSAGRAIAMADTNFTDLREQVISVLADPGSYGIGGLLEFSGKISAYRSTALDAIEIASTWIRDLIVQEIGSETQTMIHVDSLDRIAETAQHHTSEELLSAYAELVGAAELIEAPINVNRNLVIDLMLLKVARVLAGPDMGLTMRGALKDKVL